jgi:large subunit ribosomal protein L25
MANATTVLNVTPREIEGSRSNRRLRRSGRVPAVLYGGAGEPLHFSVDTRDLRTALRSAGAVIELDIEGERATAVVKDQQRDPIRGDAWHIDFVRVRMDVAIQSVVFLELTGAESAPGVVEGGVLEQQLREVNVESLPGDVPESLTFDASGLEINATLTLGDVTAPAGVTILDEPDVVVASITLPRQAIESADGVETETAVVGQAAKAPEADTGSDEAAAEGDESPDTAAE